MDQLEDNLASAELQLDDDELERISEVTEPPTLYPQWMYEFQNRDRSEEYTNTMELIKILKAVIGGFLSMVIIGSLSGCGQNKRLQEGRWSGSLTPMNHPDMNIPVNYRVSYNSNQLEIDIISSDSTLVPTRDIKYASDTLYFTFTEPEEGVQLDCALARVENDNFEGKCVDDAGKWARFRMIPPE